MFTFSDTFVSTADYLAALDETEHDYTPDPADYAPDEDFWPDVMDLTPPPLSDEDEHMIINHYRGI